LDRLGFRKVGGKRKKEKKEKKRGWEKERKHPVCVRCGVVPMGQPVHPDNVARGENAHLAPWAAIVVF